MSATRRCFLMSGVALAGGCVAPGVARAAPAGPPVVELASGRVRGRWSGGVRQFLGIPYGADTGARRFLPPEPVAPWTGVREATAYGAASPQGGDGQGEARSEDCLVLNVWAPEQRAGVKLPVLVYIHGGGYTSGSGASPLTHGANLAARGDVVVVTLNHRLNLFGHFNLGGVAGADYAASGNAGLLDLVLALEWVRDNAAAFGGDAGLRDAVRAVGRWGEDCVPDGDAGGEGTVPSRVDDERTAGDRAGSAWRDGAREGGDGASGRWRRCVAHNAGWSKLLAALSAKDPTIAGSRIYWGPVLDAALPVHPFWPEAPALSAHIPMVMGNTREETGSLIARGDPAIFDLTWETLPARLERDMVSDVDVHAAIAMYRRLYPELPPAQVFIRATSAGRSWRAQVIEAEARARQGAPTWVYQLDYSSRSNGGRYGAYHMLDIPLVFANTHEASADTGDDEAARAMAATMSDALLRFARTGDPNGGAVAEAGRSMSLGGARR
jgi:para-nitrobenzyl esterase